MVSRDINVSRETFLKKAVYMESKEQIYKELIREARSAKQNATTDYEDIMVIIMVGLVSV